MSGSQTSLFGKKDLGLLLSDKVEGITYTARTGNAEEIAKHKFAPKIDPTKKVFRHRAGKKPRWMKDSDEEEEDDEEQQDEIDTTTTEALVSSDRRLSRLKEINQDQDTGVAREAALARRRRFQAEIVAEAIEEDAVEVEQPQESEPTEQQSEVAEETGMSRRQRIKAAMLAKQTEQEEELLPVEDEEDSDSGSSEYETDTSDEDYDEGIHRTFKKPTFVAKADRLTVIQKEEKQKKEEEKYVLSQKKAEERKEKSRELVVEEIRKAEEEGSSDSDAELMPDDSDDKNQLAEFELWKIREMKRIKRDRDERLKLEREKAETERRRNMTDEERRREDAELIKKGLKKDPKAVKTKLKFMQKYYHKGSFYMDEDSMTANDPRLKTYNEPTLDDKFDKTLLPKVMQVKKFGFIGRTKYTHLVDQDTTDFTSAWNKKGRSRTSYMRRMAGSKGDLDTAGRVKRGSAKRKRN